MPANFSLVVVRRMEPWLGQCTPNSRIFQLLAWLALSWMVTRAETSLATLAECSAMPGFFSSYSTPTSSSMRRSMMVPWSPVVFLAHSTCFSGQLTAGAMSLRLKPTACFTAAPGRRAHSPYTVPVAFCHVVCIGLCSHWLSPAGDGKTLRLHSRQRSLNRSRSCQAYPSVFRKPVRFRNRGACSGFSTGRGAKSPQLELLRTAKACRWRASRAVASDGADIRAGPLSGARKTHRRMKRTNSVLPRSGD
ncbi:hypothetical protein B0T24DRAFT_624847 [Lasiosphaeria ovina]|uniref:Uncharacterized protein n=1 Tax=Lasiosphaeria ovina TaxID=92902 RepID=A0AAE0N882_9PEZI|nr:hypothetical protein B0T24DRAFT_624847 [Lasiosphaeria ovina]